MIDSPVRVSRFVAAAIAAASVLVAGPGISRATPAEIVVSPVEANVAPGGSLPFVALLDGRHPVVTAAWRVIPASLGTIGPDGVFFAGDAPGRGIVRVEAPTPSGVLVGHALVEVGRGRGRPRLRVVPESAAIEPGDEIAFHVDVSGGSPLGPPIVWSVSPATAGTIGPDGVFHAGNATGPARVRATPDDAAEMLDGVARVWIGYDVEGPAPALKLHPESATLRSGERAHFTLRVQPPLPDSLTGTVRWSLFPATLGQIGDDGVLEAGGEPGEGRVVAAIEREGRTLRAFAHARVLPEQGATLLQVLPRAALLAPGRSIRFDARLFGGRGPQPAGRPSLDVRWSVFPAELGSISVDGTLTAFGAAAYAAGSLRGEVVADAVVDGTPLEGRASVRVEIGASGELELKPRFVRTAPGGEVRVTAFLGTSPIPPEIPVEWSVIPTTLGTVTADGLFTANANIASPESDEFGRREGVLAARAILPEGKVVRGVARIVVVPILARAQISIEPSEAVIDLAFVTSTPTVRFRVVIPGREEISAGNAALQAGGAEPRVVWRVRPETLGSISADGTFQPNLRFALGAALEGLDRVEGRVIAEVRVSPRETLFGEARLLLKLPPPAVVGLSIDPTRATVASGSVLRFAGRAGGREVSSLPVKTEWSVRPPELGRISSDGSFTPNPLPPTDGATREGQIRLDVVPRTGPPRSATASVTVTYSRRPLHPARP